MEIKKKPKVSIVIPVYNGSNYMREAINSALAQTYDNLEVIVVNDGSKDGGETDRIARSYGNRILYHVKENGGVSTALNSGIESMTGDYFSWLSHDDLYTPDKIEKEMSLVQEIGGNAIIYSGYSTINESGKILGNFILPKNITQNIKCLIALDTTYTLNGCTMLIPKRHFLQYGKFDPALKYTQDYELWFRFADQGVEFVCLNECLVYSRQHNEQGGKVHGNVATIEADTLHQKAIAALSNDEVYRYIEGDLTRLDYLHCTYAANNYVATAIEIESIQLKTLSEASSNSDRFYSWMKALNVKIDACKNLNSLLRVPNKQILVFYSNVWTFGGSERVIANLIEHFCSTFHIVLISNYIEGEKGFVLPPKVTHIKIQKKETTSIAEQVANLTRAVNAALFIGNPNIMIDFLPIYQLLKQMGIKSIAINHYFYYLPYQLRWEWINNIAESRHTFLQHADAVVWLTTFSSVMWKSRHNNVVKIPNPNTYDEDEPRTFPNSKIVLAVGRFYDTIKRVDKILKVFKHVYMSDPEAKLVLVGGYDLNTLLPSPTNKRLCDLLNELELPIEAFSFEGEQNNVIRYYKQASVLLLTSECEGFGMVLTEANVFGLPIVMYYYPGCEDIVTQNENGYIIMQDDECSASDKILLLLHDPANWLRMSRSSQILSRRFKKSIIMEQWNKLLSILLTESDEPAESRLKKANLSPSADNPEYYLEASTRFLEKVIAKNFLIEKENNYANQSTIAISSQITKNTVDEANCYDEVQKMKNTISWKITAPLRLIRKWQKHNKRNNIFR